MMMKKLFLLILTCSVLVFLTSPVVSQTVIQGANTVLVSIESLLDSIDANIQTLVDNLSQDATHNNAAITTGPQGMAYGSSTTPTAVTSGMRCDCGPP